jgi:prepilin-type N-terminal cleavage/methylation domain-containing protein
MQSRSGRGFTIIEVIVVVSVMAILLIGVLSIYDQSVSIYSKNVMRGIAQTEATTTIGVIRDLTRMSVEVSECASDYVQFHMMPWDDGVGAAKLEPSSDTDYGPEVRIYRGDSSGSIGSTADKYLWVATRPDGGSSWNSRTLLSSNASDLEFACFYAEAVPGAGPAYFEIPPGTEERNTLRRINAVRVRLEAFASDETDASIGTATSYSTARTSAIVWLRNAEYMPGALRLLDPENTASSQRPRTYLTGAGLNEISGMIEL